MTISFEKHPYISAEEFLVDIGPTSSKLYDGSSGAPPESITDQMWLFRGVKSETYQLIPTALRTTGGILNITGNPPHKNRDQILAEFLVVREFYRTADLYGLAIPGDTPESRLKWDEVQTVIHKKDMIDQWPPTELIDTFALAQHYGIPTRLLDWSRDPFIAAYFAAEDHDNPKHKGSIGVWAYCLQKHQIRRILSPHIASAKTEIEVITASAASIPNLRAQKGVFTVHRPNDPIDLNGTIDRRDLTQLIEPFSAATGGRKIKDMYFFTLKRSESAKLLQLLDRCHITPAALFPGYDGVAKSVKLNPFTKPCFP